jgi:signal transduction histidine kinase
MAASAPVTRSVPLAVVFVLALGSIGLVLLSDHITQRQRTHFARASAVTDLRIKTAMAYLWVEERLSGAPAGKTEHGSEELREAKQLIDLILSGGEYENGLTLIALQEPDLRRRVERLSRLLSEFAAMVGEAADSSPMGRVNPALDRRSEVAFGNFQRTAGEVERIVEARLGADYASWRRLFFGMLVVWFSMALVATVWLVQRERRRREAERALHLAKGDLETDVAHRTDELRSVNLELSAELRQRRRMEQSLSESQEQLSAKLLTAQEIERTRISSELHDGIGNYLILTKVRLRIVETQLRADDVAAKEEVRSLSDLIQHAIDDVRRLSQNLRPSILEDIGFTAALRWLVDNCDRTAQSATLACAIDLDALVPAEARVVVYRIVQEALANAEEHADARRISVSVEHDGDRLYISIQDDGKGFAAETTVLQRGIGLATMQERARILGGTLSVWSEQGKGTRVTLAVPVRRSGGTDPSAW